ncbi:uncharacterized protein MELLADRAFT_63443 [Melampsora larici-populina 98AG31]|uniref:Uncharacterized protein n=1 Tax=Melampsora larici-populina (strain 98AG31 / pathotype 3-4-7) TaxID=747676 RepID=F4RMN3_MELLP|nr:uncharacterized protein MELLADRAFT_63443 [Melampsora larici-populina 98AG31]EGG06143.1 hypothetical protein MELLADRAFT_63443 [Melampsora larici-populina 98AG31]
MSEPQEAGDVPPILTLDRRLWIEVKDSDEEIFDIYSRLAGSTETSSGAPITSVGQKSGNGLGFLDSSSSVLEIELEIHQPKGVNSQNGSEVTLENFSSKKRGRSYKSKPKQRVLATRTITAQLHQDIYAINHRKGDTGSVVWRASVDFAELLWYDLLYPANRGIDELCDSLLNMNLLVSSLRILELGSGTGALAVLCNKMFPSDSQSSWTVSDQSSLLSTISRNLTLNKLTHVNEFQHPSQYQVEEIDWLEIEKDWMKINLKPDLDEIQSSYDLILAIDCLYNESLILPFLHTLDHIAKPQSSDGRSATLVLIVSQLRSEEVMRLFVESWIKLPFWKIFRVDLDGLRSDLKLDLSHPKYVVWFGWKVKSR